MTRQNTVWVSTCATCSATIKQVGSSRPRKYCNARCQGKHPARLKKMRERARLNYKKTGTLVRRRETNKQILIAEKLSRGECALHPLYNNGDRKFVVPGLEYLFDMDHVNRTQKHNTVAKMMPVEKYNIEGDNRERSDSTATEKP